jgi:hypothetical protein
MKDILTPAQIRLFNDPKLAELRKRFDLQPLQSKESRLGHNVTQRIEEWFAQFNNPNHIEPPRTVKYKSPITGKEHESPF